MTLSLLDLPVEVRLNIYSQLFGMGKAIVESGTQGDAPALLPAKSVTQPFNSRSGQLLRVCRAVFFEAQPILYANTTFCTRAGAFAGQLPTRLSDGNAFAIRVKHLIWQLSCDMLKHFCPEDLQFRAQDLFGLDSLELRCHVANWRGSFCGVWCDQESFVRGNAEILGYAQHLKAQMESDGLGSVFLTHDRSKLRTGRITLRIQRTKPVLCRDEILLDHQAQFDHLAPTVCAS